MLYAYTVFVHPMNPVEQLLQRPDIWRPGDRRAPPQNGLASGYPEFDRLLHSGGWPRAGLVELAIGRCGVGELRLLMPALSEVSEQGLWQVWIDPPLLPFASAWSQHNLHFDHILIVRTSDRRHWLWATEQALRAAGCGAVLSWSGNQKPRYAELRKFQVAASDRHCTGFLISDQRSAQSSSPAVLRLKLSPQADGIGIEILKQRGTQAGQRWLLPTQSSLHAQLPLRDRPFATVAKDDAALSLPLPHTTPLHEVVWQ